MSEDEARKNIRRGKEWWGNGEDEAGTWEGRILGEVVKNGGKMVRMRSGHGREGY